MKTENGEREREREAVIEGRAPQTANRYTKREIEMVLA